MVTSPKLVLRNMKDQSTLLPEVHHANHFLLQEKGQVSMGLLESSTTILEAEERLYLSQKAVDKILP